MDVISFLSLLTLLSNIFLTLLLISFLLKKYFNKSGLWDRSISFLSGQLILLSLIVAFTATAGSLYFSEISGFAPCKLCWFQRIFMYPLVIVFFVAYRISDKNVWRYSLPLSAIGAFIAAYHYYLQRAANPLVPCSTVGFSVSCSERFVMQYGFITIPWMALSAFVLITVFMFLLKNSQK